MPPNLTEIEQKILDYMVGYLRENTYQPSIREIGEEFGIKSTKTVSEHLQALADKGFLERDPSRSRGVKILGMDLNAQAVSVPCFSSLPRERGAHRTSRAEMFLTLDRRLAGNNGAFFVQAHGDELALLGCVEGDYVLLEPTRVGQLADGAVVAARIEGNPSYYLFTRNGSGAVLRPLAGSEDATVVDDAEELTILGRVTGMYRRMDHLPASVTGMAH
ncbi:MAG: transcriptional repressor LexA [Longimicrobiales bacterium]